MVSRDGDGYVLTEIKSSTSAKTEHTFDLAFQRVVLEAAGFPITRSEVAHVNNKYVKEGEIDPGQLVSITDITDKVEGQLEKTKIRIDHALDVAASGSMFDPGPERAKLKSYDEWLTIREKLDPPLKDNSIHRLPFMTAEKAYKLIETGITEIDQIEDASILGKSTKRYLSALARGERCVEKDRLSSFLSEIVYPVYYFDYETSQSLLPPWNGTRPYQQVPFQYALHIQREPRGEIEHREYLHRDRSNPMPALLSRLREDIGDTGSVLVWYEGFEKARNKEMADTFPEYAAFLKDVNARVIDLMKPFSEGMITDPAFRGSASIKAVLPVLVPEVTYSDLDIQEGGSASRLWKNVTLTDPDTPEREKVYADLVEYCTLDTWAMVAIHKALRRALTGDLQEH
ncbi:DUF2779 domain-containing protein [Actibacterium atlanticum]|uniref:DUF2779 domain-containing protein n=1 Tax=Actibacterium atlanticum TaxID=1461693 RepID=UPI002351C2F4|nr:DUF2779 domain-containing protein [Actibacterium atlanticum]